MMLTQCNFHVLGSTRLVCSAVSVVLSSHALAIALTFVPHSFPCDRCRRPYALPTSAYSVVLSATLCSSPPCMHLDNGAKSDNHSPAAVARCQSQAGATCATQQHLELHPLLYTVTTAHTAGRRSSTMESAFNTGLSLSLGD